MKRDDSNIEDVYDGALYQREFKPDGFLSEPYNYYMLDMPRVEK